MKSACFWLMKYAVIWKQSKLIIETPLETAKMPKLEGKNYAFISILRAGNGLLDGMLDLGAIGPCWTRRSYIVTQKH